ncbi:hypothetical protein C8J46_10960 [Sphingomonas sp. PP-F2F-A104-K0414]|nr:hypothetical protein C8J46_10960 [Sphingomonas sp. PP-F2F-A104-K0414]
MGLLEDRDGEQSAVLIDGRFGFRGLVRKARDTPQYGVRLNAYVVDKR